MKSKTINGIIGVLSGCVFIGLIATLIYSIANNAPHYVISLITACIGIISIIALCYFMLLCVTLGLRNKFAVKDPETGQWVDYMEIKAKYPPEKAEEILRQWSKEKEELRSDK